MRNIFNILVWPIVMCGLLQAQTFTNYTEADGLINNNINALAVDDTGNVWIATQDGISNFDPVIFEWVTINQTTDPDLIDNAITCIEIAANGDVWLGTNFGISVYDGSNWSFFTDADGLGGNRINTIKQDPDGNVWVGESNGFSFYDGANWTSYGIDEGLPSGGVTSLDFVGVDQTIIGTGLGGVLVYDGQDFLSITEAQGLIGDKITAVAVTPNANKWIGTTSGVSILDESNQVITNYSRMYIMPPPDTLNPVTAIAFDNNGAAWVGIYVDYLVTVGGVAVNSGFGWKDYDRADGLVGPAIRDIAVDANNDVWVGTSSGLTRISATTTNLEKGLQASFSVYPNPASNQLTIQLKEPLGMATEVLILDMQMRTVATSSLASGQGSMRLNLGNMSKGLYFVKIGSQVERLMIGKN